MRIVVFSKSDIFGNLAVNRLLESLTSQKHTVRVMLSDHVLDCERAGLYGGFLVAHERDFPVETFFPALDEIPDSHTAPYVSFRGIERRYNVPITQVQDVNSAENLEYVSDFAPDVILSCRHDFIFESAILGIPTHGFYNLHPGLLPEYRGLSATFWTMLERRPKATCTLYKVDQGIDTGPVVHSAEIKVDYSRSLIWNISRVYLAGVDAFLKMFPMLHLGAFPSQTQDIARSRYFTSPTTKDYQIFIEQGQQVVTRSDYLRLLEHYLPDNTPGALLGEFSALLPSHADFGLPEPT